MDARTSTNRKFPGYTTAELELQILLDKEGRVVMSRDKIKAIKAEIIARKSGKSQPFHTPQI